MDLFIADRPILRPHAIGMNTNVDEPDNPHVTCEHIYIATHGLGAE